MGAADTWASPDVTAETETDEAPASDAGDATADNDAPATEE